MSTPTPTNVSVVSVPPGNLVLPIDPGILEAEALGVEYQKAGQVRQLLAERQNMVAYGNIDRVVSIDQNLTMMGYTGDRTIGATGDPGPIGRTSRSDQMVTADASSTSTATGTPSADTGTAAGTTDAGSTDAGTSDTAPSGGTATTTKTTTTSSRS